MDPTSTKSPNNPSSNGEVDIDMLHFLRTTFGLALKDFAASEARFRVLYTVPQSQSRSNHDRISQSTASSGRRDRSSDKPSILFVLDSSFNPPSKAHLHIARSALLSRLQPLSSSTSTSSRRNTSTVQNDSNSDQSTKGKDLRLLLLLATENADKTSKPADFEDRLVMMTLMAEELRRNLRSLLSSTSTSRYPSMSQSTAVTTTDSNSNTSEIIEPSIPEIDIGVTKKPFFVDKASAIDESGIYTSASPSLSPENNDFTQIHLTGFDTLLRIFDAKYYGSDGLDILIPFLKQHRIRVLERNGVGDVPDVKDQREWVARVERGEMEEKGMRREWAGRIELVDAGSQGEGISSTEARRCCRDGKWEELGRYVGKEVGAWCRERGLYRDGARM